MLNGLFGPGHRPYWAYVLVEAQPIGTRTYLKQNNLLIIRNGKNMVSFDLECTWLEISLEIRPI
jgi:hypothetical protein